MKRGMILFIAIVANLVAAAQSTEVVTHPDINPGGFYLKGGVNFANISISDNGAADDANMLTTFNVGFIGDIPLGDILSLQTGLVLNGEGAKTTNNTFSTTTTMNPLYLQVPGNIVIKLPVTDESRFFFGAGPYVQMGIGGKETTTSPLGSTTSDIKFNNDDPSTTQQEDASFDKLKKFDIGINGLAGIESGSFMIGINYDWGLTKINSTQSNNSANDKNKFRTFSINVGFRF
jgi:opacity protein-like surface antigen